VRGAHRAYIVVPRERPPAANKGQYHRHA
jgi:hypothetical protein